MGSINKRLTREDLANYKIRIVTDDEGNYHVMRTTYFYGKVQEIELTPHKIWKTRKNVRAKAYWNICFRYERRMYNIPLSRIIYAYFCGEVPEGYHVDHKDNNPNNNSIWNLQILTPSDNNRKKKLDAFKKIDLTRDDE